MTSNDNPVPGRESETVVAAAAWARTAEFAWPLRWGDIEDSVLDQPFTSADTGAAGAAAQGALRTVAAVVVGGAALIGLALILVLRGTEDSDLQALAGTGTLVAFIVALGVVVGAAFIWWDSGRPRSPLGLGLAGGTGAVSAAAFVAFQGADYADDRNALFIRLLTIGAAVVGVGLFGAMLLASTGADTTPRRRRWSLDVGRELKAIVARNTVLDVLVERGLARLDGKEKERIASMPLGTWHELDTAQR